MSSASLDRSLLLSRRVAAVIRVALTNEDTPAVLFEENMVSKAVFSFTTTFLVQKGAMIVHARYRGRSPGRRHSRGRTIWRTAEDSHQDSRSQGRQSRTRTSESVAIRRGLSVSEDTLMG